MHWDPHYSLPPGRNRMDAIGGSDPVEGGGCASLVCQFSTLQAALSSVVSASPAWLLMKKLSKTNSRRGPDLNLAF